LDQQRTNLKKREEALFFENLTNDFKVYNAVEIDGIIIFGLLNH